MWRRTLMTMTIVTAGIMGTAGQAAGGAPEAGAASTSSLVARATPLDATWAGHAVWEYAPPPSRPVSTQPGIVDGATGLLWTMLLGYMGFVLFAGILNGSLLFAGRVESALRPRLGGAAPRRLFRPQPRIGLA
jgi:hypothetical protein